MGRGARAWAEGGVGRGVEWAEAEDGQKRWVVRVGGLGRGGFMGGVRGAPEVGRGWGGQSGWFGQRDELGRGGLCVWGVGQRGQGAEELWVKGAGGKRGGCGW